MPEADEAHDAPHGADDTTPDAGANEGASPDANDGVSPSADADGNDGTNPAAWLIGFVAGAVILALMLAAYTIGFNRGEDEGREQAGTGTPPAAETSPDDGGGDAAPADDAGGGDVAPGDDAGGGDVAPADDAGGGEQATDVAARELFVAQCGTCHVLADAGTEGAIGPDLDQLGADEARLLAAIENGGTGAGPMPAGLLGGTEAEDVAAYIAGAAGQ